MARKKKMEWTFRDGTKSTIHLLTAGTTERKTDLAKGHGLAFLHATEIGEWGSETAFNSLVASLAQKNPNRLYIFESTGEGSNHLDRNIQSYGVGDSRFQQPKNGGKNSRARFRLRRRRIVHP